MTRSLRVLHLIDSLGHGGAERVLVTVCRELSRRGVDVHVGVMQERDGNPAADQIAQLGIPVRSLDVRSLRHPRGYTAVRDVIRDVAPDGVHTHLEFANVLGTLASYRQKIPSLATLHTLDAPAPPSRAWIRARAVAFVLRRYARLVVTVSESARAHHLAFGTLRADRAAVIYNGTDLAAATLPGPADRERIRRSLDLPEDAPVVTTVAVQRDGKGLDVLIEAIAAVRAQQPLAVCLLVGDGPLRNALESRVRADGLHGVVRFLGMRSDVLAVLLASDVYVQPSLVDALPTTVMEAMAAGLPIVATHTGGIPEMVDHGRTGMLVEPGRADLLASAILDLLEHPEQRRLVGDRARHEALDRFHPASAVDRLMECYQMVLNRI